ncbi:RlpA-like double-psi beta-barrel-protein domain-containing protein-containing protein [Spinellus fusiger]|nr:RlpA-like double-psi beta-barrel-protein domain-containing protein-containing protein [Spinellus fusiger]
MKLTVVLFPLLVHSLSHAHAYPLERRDNSGSGTFYEVGLGSCGESNTDSQLVVALSSILMEESYCGKKIKATSGHHSVTATVVDNCPGCDVYDIDLSPAAFEKLASLDVGRLSLQWSFV